jgi:tetratricopeptide (TPR) repeat protein
MAENEYLYDDLQKIEAVLINLFLNQQYLLLEEQIDPVIKRNPTWLNGWKILSDTYLIQGKDAKLPAQRALALNLNDANEHCYYGLILKSEGDLKGAEKAFTEAIRLNPHYAAAHNNLGIIKKDLGDVAAGIQHYQTALGINPSYSDCYSNLLFCLSHYDQIDSKALYQAHIEFS